MIRRAGINHARAAPRPCLPFQLPASGANGSPYSFIGPGTGQINTGHYWTPTGYSGTKWFPILYALHGKGGTSATTVAQVLPRLQDAIYTNKQIRECILIMPSIGDTWYSDSFDGATPREQQFIRDLVPYFDAHLRVDTSRRIITGFSMGCFGATRLVFKYPELFRALYGLAGPNMDADSNNAWAGSDSANYASVWNSTIGLLRTDSPTASTGGNGLLETRGANIIARNFPIRLVKSANDPASLNSQNNFDSRLTSAGVAHTFVDLVTPTHSVGLYYTTDAGAGFAFLEQYL